MAIGKALQKAASRATRKLGTDVVFQSISVSEYNVDTGETIESIRETRLKGILENVDVKSVESSGLVELGDKKLTIAARDLGRTVSLKDRVLVNNRIHQIIDIRTTENTGFDVIYQVFLRK